MLFNFIPDSEKAPSPFNASDEEFLPLNVDNIARRLRLEKRGKERGHKNLPPHDAAQLDDIELSIYSEIAKHTRKAKSDLTDYFAAFRERGAAIGMEGMTDLVRSEAQDTTTRMFAEVRVGTNGLFRGKRDLVAVSKALENFKKRNGLERPASYPDGHARDWAVLFFMFSIESIANATVLGGAHEFGIVGAAMEMLVISFINIAFGVATGWFAIPLFFHRSLVHRLLGVMLTATACLVIIGFNLFVGHYRDAKILIMDPSVTAVTKLGAAAVTALRENPFGLQDFMSWSFTLIGVIFAAIAMGKGFKWDDPYPGYGLIDRQHKNINHEYGALFERLQLRIETFVNQGKKQIQEICDDAVNHREELMMIFDRVRGLQSKLSDYYSTLEQDGQQLLQRYRYANMETRSEKPPAHFDQLYSLDGQLKQVPEFGEMVELDLRAFNNSAKKARRGIERRHLALLDIYKTIDQLTVEELETATVGTFTAKVEDLESKGDVDTRADDSSQMLEEDDTSEGAE